MEEKSKDVALSYDILTKFDDDLAHDFLRWCLDVEDLNEELLVIHNVDVLPDLVINISSDGGSVQSLFDMLSALTILPNRIIIRGFGLVASSALFFYLIAGDIRLANEYTEFLYHNMSYSIDQVNLESHRRVLKESDKLQAKIDRLITENSNITLKQLKNKKNEDWIIDYKLAVDLGVVNFVGNLRDLYEEEESGGKAETD